jgi:hypothetical protein
LNNLQTLLENNIQEYLHMKLCRILLKPLVKYESERQRRDRSGRHEKCKAMSSIYTIKHDVKY